MHVSLSNFRVYTKSTNLRQEPKFVVFLSQLLLLFKFCPYCKADNPLVEARRTGTGVVITTNCSHPKCGRRQDVWRSQPYMPDTMVNAGDFLLCFAILLSGGSASKVINLFKHMGLSSISLATFFQHQRVCKTVAYFIWIIVKLLQMFLIMYFFLHLACKDKTVSYNLPSLE